MVTATKRNAIPHFQRQSRTYERSWLQPRFFEPAQQAVLASMEHFLPAQPHTVLDVGCGTGRLLRSIHERWPQAALTGIDPTPGMVAMAQQLTAPAALQVGFAEALPLSKASVDGVVSTFSFHHWSDQAAGLREIARVLRPQGYFFLADAMAPAWFAQLFSRLPFRTPERIRFLFGQVGLQVLHQQSAVNGWVLITVGKKEGAPDEPEADR